MCVTTDDHSLIQCLGDRCAHISSMMRCSPPSVHGKIIRSTNKQRSNQNNNHNCLPSSDDHVVLSQNCREDILTLATFTECRTMWQSKGRPLACPCEYTSFHQSIALALCLLNLYRICFPAHVQACSLSASKKCL